MFNTGTVLGVSTNIHGTGFPSKFVPSFVWVGTTTKEEYEFEKACETMTRVKGRRSDSLNKEDKDVMQNIFKQTANYRSTYLK